MIQSIIDRVMKLLTSPGSEWDVIDGEDTAPMGILTNYVLILAAIPALAGLIASVIRGGIVSGVISAVIAYAIAVAVVYLMAFIIDMFAPTFGGQKNFNQAFKVAAYSGTPGWVFGVAGILGFTLSLAGIASLIGLAGAIWGLVLLFIGLPKLMKPPADKATVYTVVVIIAAIVAIAITSIGVGMITAPLLVALA